MLTLDFDPATFLTVIHCVSLPHSLTSTGVAILSLQHPAVIRFRRKEQQPGGETDIVLLLYCCYSAVVPLL